MNQEAEPLAIWAIRLIHTLVALIFFAAIAVIYVSAIFGTYNLWLYLSLGVLLIEIIAVRLNRGNCPLEFIPRKYGEDKTFFELFLPKNVAKRMFKVCFVVVLIGCLLLLFRFLF